MRAVLFYLLPERYVDPDDQAWSYLLAELPTFLFFSAFTILIYIWARAINSKDEQRKRAVLIAVVAFNALMYLIFVLLIVLWNTLPDDSDDDDDDIPCSQLFPEDDDDDGLSDSQLTLAIVYKIFIASLAGLLAIGIIAYGVRIIKLMSGAHGNWSSQMKVRITMLTILCAVAFLADSVYLLIVLIVEEGSYQDWPWAVLLLLLFEAVPAAVVIYVLRPKAKRDLARSTSNTGSSVASSKRLSTLGSSKSSSGTSS